MITSTICKFVVESVTDFGNNHKQYKLRASYDSELCKDEKAFSTQTPSGELSITINNPAVHELLKPGMKVMLEITPVGTPA